MADAIEYIDEDPLTPAELERHLVGQLPTLTRKERRQFLYVIRRARLIVFHA